MVASNLINENEEYVREAINSGIDGETIESTLNDVVEKSDSTGKTPTQLKDTVESIVEMKSSVKETTREEFASDLVKNNSEKIKSAINEGIEPEEVATTLVNSTEKANTKKGKKHLNFLVKLISKMKKKELRLKKDKVQEKGRQKVLGK